MNKFEKEKRVIELHIQGKTIRQIAPAVHKNFSDISKIIKTYERKKESKRKVRKQSSLPKKPPISTQAFKLFRDGQKLTDVAIDLEIPARRALKLCSQFLRLERMEDCYEFYKDYEYDIPTFLSINNFIKRNNVYGKDITGVLKTATDINHLNQIHYNLKSEVKNLEQKKMYLQNYSHSSYGLQPLPFNKPNYNYYYY